MERKRSEAYEKRFDGYQHFVVMLFGILKYFDSLCELEKDMMAEAHKLGHLGMNYLVRLSTFAGANPPLNTTVTCAKRGPFAKRLNFGNGSWLCRHAQFQRLTEEGVCYVTKMEKNLKYEVLESVMYVNTK